MMKAIIQHQHGAPRAVLELQDIATPMVKDDQVLVRVRAASINVGDCLLVTGVPHVLRMVTGLRKPKNRVPGTDIAGTVEAVGKDVTQLRPGDNGSEMLNRHDIAVGLSRPESESRLAATSS